MENGTSSFEWSSYNLCVGVQSHSSSRMVFVNGAFSSGGNRGRKIRTLAKIDNRFRAIQNAKVNVEYGALKVSFCYNIQGYNLGTRCGSSLVADDQGDASQA